MVLCSKGNAYMGGSSPSTARPPHPNLRKPVFTTMYDFATLKSPPGTGFLFPR